MTTFKRTSGKNVGGFIAYLLRTGETGLVCTSSIMQNEKFLTQLARLEEKQREEFKYSSTDIERLKTRDFQAEHAAEVAKAAADSTYKMKNILRAEKKALKAIEQYQVLRTKARKIPRRDRNSAAQAVVDTLHRVSKTQLFTQTGARTGYMVLQSFSREASADQVIDLVKTVRDAFPKEHPSLFTVHYGKDGQAPHIQGWVSARPFDLENGTWPKLSAGETVDGRGQVDRERVSCFTTEGRDAIRAIVNAKVDELGIGLPDFRDATSVMPSQSVRAYARHLMKQYPREDFKAGVVLQKEAEAGRPVRSELAKRYIEDLGARARRADTEVWNQTSAAERREAFVQPSRTASSEDALQMTDRCLEITTMASATPAKLGKRAAITTSEQCVSLTQPSAQDNAKAKAERLAAFAAQVKASASSVNKAAAVPEVHSASTAESREPNLPSKPSIVSGSEDIRAALESSSRQRLPTHERKL